jgi:hypothetical protein
MIPRRPVNLYYNVTTPSQWTNEYNYLYHSYWGRDLSFSEILDKESDVLLQYMLRGEIDPWMFHQGNLRAYDGVHFLLGDLLDRTLEKYSRIFVLPVRSMTMAGLGEWTKNRMRYDAAGIRCSFVPSNGTITMTAPQAAIVPVTGLCTESSEDYGGQCISHVSMAPGQTVSYSFAAPSSGTPPTAGVVGDPSMGGVLRASISVNPINPASALRFRTTRAGFARVRVFDLAGRMARSLVDESNLPPGPHEVRMGVTRELPTGTYLYRIEAAEGTATGRFVVLR